MKKKIACNEVGFDFDRFVKYVHELPYSREECEKLGYYNIYGHCLNVKTSEGKLVMEYSTELAGDGTLYNVYCWYVVSDEESKT